MHYEDFMQEGHEPQEALPAVPYILTAYDVKFLKGLRVEQDPSEEGPAVPYVLNHNDKRLLHSLRIEHGPCQ